MFVSVGESGCVSVCVSEWVCMGTVPMCEVELVRNIILSFHCDSASLQFRTDAMETVICRTGGNGSIRALARHFSISSKRKVASAMYHFLDLSYILVHSAIKKTNECDSENVVLLRFQT